MTWQEKAACTRVRPEIFDEPWLVGLEGRARKREAARHVARARKYCTACPVRNDCLALGVTDNADGIYAGVWLHNGAKASLAITEEQ